MTRLLAASAATTAVWVLLAMAAAPFAHADGDPASDVLAAQSVFLPADAALAPGRQSQLEALVRAAAGAGYSVRVAVIATRADLGSVTELWHQPQSYAHFLAQELGLVYRGRVLVVMPDGYGLYDITGARPREAQAVAGLAVRGTGLDVATLRAVERLAAAAGHPVALPQAASDSESAGGGVLPWVVFGAGLMLILLAWAASLRARPLRLNAS